MWKRMVSLLLAFTMLCTMLPQLFLNASATASPITTNVELVERAVNVANNYKTLYVMGGWGQPLTEANKQRLINAQSYNQDSTRKAMINAATADTFAFDCVCFIKGLLWGWDGTLSATNGGAVYGSNGVSDVNADGMINICTEVSTDFSEIEIGEVVWTNGHVGLYIGDGQVVECTPSWKNCVQITGITGYQNWIKHGKLPYVKYVAVSDMVKKTYPAHCSIITTENKTYIKSMPCSADSDANSIDIETAPKGTHYIAIGLIENKYGNLWYKVQAKNGSTGYIYAGAASYAAQCISDIKGSGITSPSNHTVGNIYILTGTVSATYNQLTSVSAYVYAGNSEQGAKETGGSAAVSNNSIALGGSSIDTQTEFNKLPVGTHTYVVWASYKNYYAKSATSVAEKTGEIGLYKATFNVVSAPQSCSHSYSSKVTTAASCANEGIRTYTCTKCGASYSESIPATGSHNYMGEVTEEAYCGGTGIKTYTCSGCSACYTETIPATGEHTWGQWEIVQEATCFFDGIKLQQCAVCNLAQTETIPAAHTWGEWETIEAPTCTSKGLKMQECTVCELIYTDTIEATGHHYVSITVEPKCETQGYTQYGCYHCFDYYEDSYVPAIGHQYEDGICVNCGEHDPDAVIKGDLDGDGEVTAADAVLLARFLADLIELDEKQLKAADIDDDGEITSADSVLLARFLAELIEEL